MVSLNEIHRFLLKYFNRNLNTSALTTAIIGVLLSYYNLISANVQNLFTEIVWILIVLSILTSDWFILLMSKLRMSLRKY